MSFKKLKKYKRRYTWQSVNILPIHISLLSNFLPQRQPLLIPLVYKYIIYKNKYTYIFVCVCVFPSLFLQMLASIMSHFAPLLTTYMRIFLYTSLHRLLITLYSCLLFHCLNVHNLHNFFPSDGYLDYFQSLLLLTFLR